MEPGQKDQARLESGAGRLTQGSGPRGRTKPMGPGRRRKINVGVFGRLNAQDALVAALEAIGKRDGTIREYLIVNPILGYGTMGTLSLWSFFYGQRSKRRGEARRAAAAAVLAVGPDSDSIGG